MRLTDPAAVVGAVAEAVGSSQQWASTPDAALVASLARRDGILVLDNCEHLLDGVRDCVEQIVTACPQITVLATTRTRLLLPYECLFAVPGLSVPDAVELFAARVHEATGEAVSDAGRVGALCQALDGMALAIELAASRYPALGLDGLEAGLHERLRFFTVGSHTAGRHRSLRDTIRWSYDLLDPADQALLRGVAVFASWFDVDAAVAVVAPGSSRATVADGLARLVDHSLLVVDRSTPTRYRALETIRQYGQEQLETTNELAEVERRHEAWCCAVLAEIAAAEPDDAWCERFDRVVDDARAALVRCAAFHDHRARCQRHWLLSWPGSCGSAGASRRHDAGSSRLPIWSLRRRSESSSCATRPARRARGSPATTCCVCSAGRRTSRCRSATPGVPPAILPGCR